MNAEDAGGAGSAGNAGEQLIAWLYEDQLQIDDQWAERGPDGFRWWPDQQAQSVQIIGQDTAPDGTTGYFIAVQTELLRAVQLDDQRASTLNEVLMLSAAMCGVVYDEERGLLNLCSLIRVHDGNAEWMRPLIAAAAMLQVVEAAAVAAPLAEALGAEVAAGGHPEHGPRPEPAELVRAIPGLFGPPGNEPSRWTEEEFKEAFEAEVDKPPALSASLQDGGFVVQVPCGDYPVLCRVLGSEPHPRYGNGLFVLQQFPVTPPSDADGVGLALAFNGIELTQRSFGYGFGSYAYREGGFYFLSFFPNAVHMPGLLANIYWACVQRAQAVYAVLSAGEDEAEG
jgi:hypothetical protein